MKSKQNYTEYIKAQLLKYDTDVENVDAVAEALNSAVTIDNYRHDPEVTISGKKYPLDAGIKQYCTKYAPTVRDLEPKSREEILDNYQGKRWEDISITERNKLYRDDPYLYSQLKERCS